jgi:crossover junction endodeoxyribonuclease RuvC
MIILGIDPGSVILGYGAVKTSNSSKQLVEYGVIKTGAKTQEFSARLLEIYLNLQRVFDRVSPDAISLETMFYHKNAQSLIKLAQARSIAMLVAAQHNVPIIEYSPTEVKKSVTGRGNASKQQVQYFVRSMLNISETPDFFDATDALAIALCHIHKSSNILSASSTKVKSWKDYALQNQDKIIKY